MLTCNATRRRTAPSFINATGVRALRVGLITEDFNPHGGGAERWTAQFAAHLVRMGHQVHVIAFQVHGAFPDLIVHQLADPRGVFARARVVEAAVASLGPIVWHDGGTSWSGHVFHPMTGSRLFSLEQEIRSHVAWRRARARVSPMLNWRRLDMARIEHRAAANASRVIAISRQIHTILADRHRLPLARLAVVTNGIDTARFSPERLFPYRAAERDRLKAGDATLCLLVAHNLRLKGLDTALRALSMLRAQGADVRLVVAGGLPDRLWSGLASRLGLADRVTFAGDVRDIEPLYAAADVLVHPTRWDSYSLATIEAMAAGLPVVTTAVNGAADLITHSTDGFVLAEPNDHTSLARHVAELRDPAARRRIGDAARRTAASADIVVNCRAVEAILAEVGQELQYVRP